MDFSFIGKLTAIGNSFYICVPKDTGKELMMSKFKVTLTEIKKEA